MKCSTCGEEHKLLDPIFRRPDAVVTLSEAERESRVKENDDLCVIRAQDAEPADRYFVRCLLPVRVLDTGGVMNWGIWTEVAESDCRRIWERWDDPRQMEEPPMPARLANHVGGYPETIGIAVSLQLVDPKTRPRLTLDPEDDHPFALECLQGIRTHRIMDWLKPRHGGS